MATNPFHSVMKRLARLRRRPLVAQRRGALWLLYPSDWIDNRLYIGKPYENAQVDFAIRCIDTQRLTAFYDCGANIGVYSVLLALRFPALTVTAFEPVPRTFHRLISNIGLNALERRVTAHNFGLSAHAGAAQIAFDAASSGVATLDAATAGNSKRQYNETVDIALMTLDAVAAPTGERLFLKIDVEGHELPALAGMRRLLSSNRCVVQIEVWDKNGDGVKAFFAELGYRPLHRIENDFYFSNTASPAN